MNPLPKMRVFLILANKREGLYEKSILSYACLAVGAYGECSDVGNRDVISLLLKIMSYN